MEVLNQILDMLKVVWLNLDSLILAINGVIGVLVVIFLAIPGDQPEKAFKDFAEKLSKFSRKPKE
jgi:hypothetical protein